MTVPPSMLHLGVNDLDDGLVHAGKQGGRFGRNRLAESGERLVGRHGAIDVERTSHCGPGTPAEQDTHRSAQHTHKIPISEPPTVPMGPMLSVLSRMRS